MSATWCPTLLASVGPDHRCAACNLQGRLRDSTEREKHLRNENVLLRDKLAKLTRELGREREERQIAERRIDRMRAMEAA